ncbi:MAG: DUF1080 domain-containing protein [Flavobacteriaceae bacterium]
MKRGFLIAAALFTLFSLTGRAQEANPLEGRWNLTIDFQGKERPSWLEIRHSGDKTLVGRFVFATGSARPVSEVKFQGKKFNFAIPPQWEPGNSDMKFTGELKADKLEGSMTYTDGKSYSWTATRAPELTYVEFPKWGETIALFNGKDLSGWRADGPKNWNVKNGILTCPGSVSNLVSEQKFNNFKLHAEFRYPKGSNSGIYLRGRYEVQIIDSKGMEPSDILLGGIYGFLTPNVMAAKAAGEWQTYDIILIGRRVTVIANGTPIIMDQIIPGMTGGAIDNNEATPGPFMIQGDHGAVEFRVFEVTPILE